MRRTKLKNSSRTRWTSQAVRQDQKASGRKEQGNAAGDSAYLVPELPVGRIGQPNVTRGLNAFGDGCVGQLLIHWHVDSEGQHRSKEDIYHRRRTEP